VTDVTPETLDSMAGTFTTGLLQAVNRRLVAQGAVAEEVAKFKDAMLVDIFAEIPEMVQRIVAQGHAVMLNKEEGKRELLMGMLVAEFDEVARRVIDKHYKS